MEWFLPTYVDKDSRSWTASLVCDEKVAYNSIYSPTQVPTETDEAARYRQRVDGHVKKFNYKFWMLWKSLYYVVDINYM